MLESSIPVKTAAGRQEIDERKHKLGPRHRMVLISINDAVEKPPRSLSFVLSATKRKMRRIGDGAIPALRP